jgi:lysophospholipase L1-like esterase
MTSRLKAVGRPTQEKAFASGVKVAVLGDSITWQNDGCNVGASLVLSHENSGFFSWAKFLLGQPFFYPLAGTVNDVFTAANYGISGDTSTAILARVNDVLNYQPDICIVLAGTNDLTTAGVTALDTITGNLNSIYTTLTNAGILVVAIPILPRGGWGSLSAPEILVARLRQNRVNDYIRHWGRRSSNRLYRVADPTQYIINTASATDDPLSTTMRSDLIHPNPEGAYYMGLAVRDALADYSKFGFTNAFGQLDLYDATNNTTGNLLVNPTLTGTAGATGTGVSGNVATSWSALRGSGTGATVVASKRTTTAFTGLTGIAQRLVIVWDGLGSVEERFDFRLTSNIASGFTTGDVIEGGAEVAVTSMTGRHMGIQVQLEATGGTSTTATDMDRYDSSNLMLNINHSGRFRTPRLIIPSGTTALNLRFNNRYLNTLAGGVTIDISNTWIRKVL